MHVPQQLVPMTIHQADGVIRLVTQLLSQPFRQWLWMNYVLWNVKKLFVAQNMKRDMLRPCAVQNHNHGIYKASSIIILNQGSARVPPQVR